MRIRLRCRLLPAGLVLAFAAGPLAAASSEAVAGIDTADMDRSASACRSFYRYANGGWLKANPIPPEYPYWGTFQILREHNQEVLRKILEEAAADRGAVPDSDVRKLGDFYGSCMDEARVESDGAKPLAAELARIAAISDLGQLQDEVARLQTFGVGVLFNFGSQQDRKDSTQVIAGAYQGGLGLPDRDYYTKTDDKSKDLRGKYAAHVQRMFELLGDDSAKAQAEAGTVMEIETKLAEASMTRVERRDPDKTYHRMDVDGIAKLTPGFSWTRYFSDVGAPPLGAVNVGQPKFFEALGRDLAAVPVSDWKTYLRWHLIHSAAPALSSDFVDADFDFYGHTLNGTEKNLPRWKRCVQAADGYLGFALGRLYVRRVFPPEAKKAADKMVHNLIAALREDLKTLPWMGPETRKAALAKLDAFHPKIGYPDKWRDYSAYRVDRGPYVENVLRGELFEFHRDLAKIGKPVDRSEWGMTPPTVNAYYNPPKNEIVFPAGILQPPFFDAKADAAVNYGGIGAVIGHEMTHGFDDQGRKFDAHGNLHDWWTPQDEKNFEERAHCVEKQFDSYEVQPGLHENGKLVLGESIADLGGLTIAHKAYELSLRGKPAPAPIDGLTADQRFFLAWAHVWASNDRPEFERLLVNTNPHPLGRFRAIGAPSNMPAFSRAFGCKAGDPMDHSGAELCQIW
jgi:putative endopeptidase